MTTFIVVSSDSLHRWLASIYYYTNLMMTIDFRFIVIMLPLMLRFLYMPYDAGRNDMGMIAAAITPGPVFTQFQDAHI